MAEAKGLILNQAFSATDTITSANITSIPGDRVRGMIFTVFCDQAGTLNIDWIDASDNVRQGAIKASYAVSANTFDLIDVDFFVPKSQVRFTPNAQPGTILVEAYYY